METSKVVAITGSILGGGGLTGLAIKYFPSSEKSESVSEETIQPQPTVKKKYNPKRITKEEAKNYESKFKQWTGENCELRIRIKGKDWGAADLENKELDLNGLEEAWEKYKVKNTCESNETIEAEKGENGEWSFYDEKEAAKLDIVYWSEQNGNCRIQIEEDGTYKEVSSVDTEASLEDVRTRLNSNEAAKASCKKQTDGKTTLLIFKKSTEEETDVWKIEESTISDQ